MPKPTTTGELLNMNQEIKLVRSLIILKLSPLILKMPKPTTTGEMLNLNQEIKQVRLKI
jgi:hypothetical protein